MANIESNIAHENEDQLIAPEGWTIISEPEVNTIVTALESSKHVVKDINDYFEVVGDVERKCNLCSREIRLNAEKNSWPLKRHFKSKHQAEWNKLLPFMKKYNKVGLHSVRFVWLGCHLSNSVPIELFSFQKKSNADGNEFELIAADGTKIVESDPHGELERSRDLKVCLQRIE